MTQVEAMYAACVATRAVNPFVRSDFFRVAFEDPAFMKLLQDGQESAAVGWLKSAAKVPNPGDGYVFGNMQGLDSRDLDEAELDSVIHRFARWRLGCAQPSLQAPPSGETSEKEWEKDPPAFWDADSKEAWRTLAENFKGLVGMDGVKTELFQWMQSHVSERQERQDASSSIGPKAATNALACLEIRGWERRWWHVFFTLCWKTWMQITVVCWKTWMQITVLMCRHRVAS